MKYRTNLAAKDADIKLGKDHELTEYIERRISDDKLSPAKIFSYMTADRLFQADLSAILGTA